MSNKTIIACRPGFKHAAESAFAGMKVIVDDTLTKDYEFREEAMTLDELMAADDSIPDDIATGNATMPAGCVWPTELA